MDRWSDHFLALWSANDSFDLIKGNDTLLPQDKHSPNSCLTQPSNIPGRYFAAGSKPILWSSWRKFCAGLFFRAPRQRGGGEAPSTVMEHMLVIDQFTSGGEGVGRRAWLVKQEISFWRLGIVVCVLFALIWVGWRIFAQTAALKLGDLILTRH